MFECKRFENKSKKTLYFVKDFTLKAGKVVLR